ncbi:hypothetical protein [Halanaerobium sp. ST460_2HS_T2]|jgi:hypothetical protein|uniref:hypothetical protein n=1 Tax=Halanaerobium sp. ST460_2HS_T2 TaxID=2183914 RepID=UPI000DF21261|nr:hypothetical protein [Halanaerobium sp. ST460_2HS_T2]RCW51622.1 chromatin associated protein KTI12 [Halanaerobium sp. ST460_2HS_T2]
MNTKLILIEGIPGSGKTTTASYIKNYLDQNNMSNKIFKEGNLDHPADYESTSCISKKMYNKIQSKLKIDNELLANYTIKREDSYLIEYGKLYHNKKINLNFEILNQIVKYDVYNLPIKKHSRLLEAKWRKFSNKAAAEDNIYIFECCFLQNPLTTMMAYHNSSKNYIINHIKKLEATISKLNPLLILLEPKNIKEQFARIKKERSKKWLDFVIDYVTNQSYGQKNNLYGYQGLIEFYQNLAELELKIFSKLNLNKILIKTPHANWEQNYDNINSFLKKCQKTNQ